MPAGQDLGVRTEPGILVSRPHRPRGLNAGRRPAPAIRHRGSGHGDGYRSPRRVAKDLGSVSPPRRLPRWPSSLGSWRPRSIPPPRRRNARAGAEIPPQRRRRIAIGGAGAAGAGVGADLGRRAAGHARGRAEGQGRRPGLGRGGAGHPGGARRGPVAARPGGGPEATRRARAELPPRRGPQGGRDHQETARRRADALQAVRRHLEGQGPLRRRDGALPGRDAGHQDAARPRAGRGRPATSRRSPEAEVRPGSPEEEILKAQVDLAAAALRETEVRAPGPAASCGSWPTPASSARARCWRWATSPRWSRRPRSTRATFPASDPAIRPRSTSWARASRARSPGSARSSARTSS